MAMPVLETERLTIRPYTMDDVAAAHRIMDRCFGDGSHAGDSSAIEAYRPWVQWMSLNPQMLASLHQPPYGDRATVLRATQTVIGQVVYAPLLDVYDQIPELGSGKTPSSLNTLELGLFWAIDPDYQAKGYAT